MNWFWHAILIAIVVIPVTILWLSCVFDIFGRHDLGAASTVLWLLAILIVPFLGSLIYLLARPPRITSFAEPTRAATSTVTEQLSELDRLHSTDAIDDHEFQVAKAAALANVPTPRDAVADSREEQSGLKAR
jgi:hypothetical protein